MSPSLVLDLSGGEALGGEYLLRQAAVFGSISMLLCRGEPRPAVEQTPLYPAAGRVIYFRSFLAIDGIFRRQRGLRLVTSNGALLDPTKDGAPARLVVLAHTWRAELRKGEVSVSEFAEREGLNAAYVSRAVRLAFLSPAVTQAELDGRLRDGVDGEYIKSKGGLIASWREQELAMLPAA